MPDMMNANRLNDLSVKIYLYTAVLILCGWILQGQSLATEKADVLKTFAHGHINWSAGSLTSSGVAAPAAKNETTKAPQALEEALAQARALALQHMRDIVLETRVDSLNLVGSIAATNDIMMAKVESLAKSAKAVKQKYLSDGTVEVTMQMPMYGGFAATASYCFARSVACCTNGPNRLSASDTKRSWLVVSLSCLSADKLEASPSGT